jgi:hypothetical protein
MKKLNQATLAIFFTLSLSACGQSIESLCVEHERLVTRMSELVVLGVANRENFNETEFKKVTSDLEAIKKKLQDKGSSGRACG